ncbi:NAD(P)H-binding protein [Kribbella qitaiheensis]|uniref:NAD(P)H-binding protein n=1 Tax=Kribbella qitaiheensis TaxID=1544730 RepID=A0A7G6WX67_9ACTN|nr:NAD(P)H-binding protein [Kribbella qitaiheensis]QNE18582.1 NAD(P)H-binding protein [Kribbella qitaiheensis]
MLLVVGGTGDLGGRVVRLLRDQGNEVRCLVREGSDDSELRRLGVQVTSGDLTEPGSLAAACQGIATIVATATVIARRLAGAKKPSIKEADEVGMASLVDAAEAAGVRRFVYISFPGVEDASGSPLELAKLAIEKRLERSTLQRVVVRADAFQEIHLAPLGRFDLAAGKVAVIGKGNSRRRWISTADVAALLAAVAVEPDPPTLIEVGGPEAISRNEAVAIAEALIGRPLKVQHMPRLVARLAVRLLSRSNDGLASVFGTGLLQDVRAADWDDEPLRRRGIEPRSATTYLREQVRLLADTQKH